MLVAAVASVVLAGPGGDLPPGQPLELGVPAGLVLLHDEDVMGVPGDQEQASTDGGASAIHSPMAVNDCAPASTAAIAAASTDGSGWRRARRLRGSGTRSRCSSKLR